MLAEQLGMTVQALVETMGNDEYHQWRAFYSLRAKEAERAAKRYR